MTQFASLDSSAPQSELGVSWRSDGEYSPSHVREISRTGAFIMTPRPAPLGTILDLRLDVPGREMICAQAVVRRVVPGEGMAVEFECMSGDARARLELLVPLLPPADLDPAPLPEAGQAPAAPASSPSLSPGSTQQERQRPAVSRQAHRRIERRAHLRQKLSVTVELSEPGTTRSAQALLTELATSGCYVKLAQPFPMGTALRISIAANGQSFHALARVASTQPGEGMGLAFTGMAPEERLILDGWLTTSLERSWLAANRRRSHRIMVNIPVQVAAKNSGGSEISEDTKTISVSAHGALLYLAMDVAKGQTVLLTNAATSNTLECSVHYLGAKRNGRREVGLSFVAPNQTLWQISFPPEDWSPQHPDAKHS